MLLAFGEVALAAQGIHSLEPKSNLYVPCGHSRHSIPSNPVCPTSQMQSKMYPLPGSETVFAGQTKQSVEFDGREAGRY